VGVNICFRAGRVECAQHHAQLNVMVWSVIAYLFAQALSPLQLQLTQALI
jgi:hypothetical protein